MSGGNEDTSWLYGYDALNVLLVDEGTTLAAASCSAGMTTEVLAVPDAPHVTSVTPATAYDCALAPLLLARMDPHPVLALASIPRAHRDGQRNLSRCVRRASLAWCCRSWLSCGSCRRSRSAIDRGRRISASAGALIAPLRRDLWPRAECCGRTPSHRRLDESPLASPGRKFPAVRLPAGAGDRRRRRDAGGGDLYQRELSRARGAGVSSCSTR